jgi:hypothetical protein
MGSRHYGIDLNISRVAIGAVVVMKAIMGLAVLSASI